MKLLILHASFGSGHKRAADAIAEAFREKTIEPEVRDLLEFLPAPMAKFYSSAYEFMITKSRLLWRFTYELVNFPKAPYSPAKAFTQRWQFSRLKEFVSKGDFTDVLSTHFTPSALFCDWLASGDLRARAYSVVTDHEAHRCWKRAGLNHYFVATKAVAEQMKTCGIPEDRLSVTGIPVSLAFSTEISRQSARALWNLRADEKVVLVLCSALTARTSARMLGEFARLKIPVRFLVSAGKDVERENHLKMKFQQDPRFVIFGFSDQIPTIMSASDLIVTKPGGLIVSEAMARGVPQILLEPIPGQEEANARYAEDAGAAIRFHGGPENFLQTLRQAIESPGNLEFMREAAKKAGRPDAARNVAETILSKDVV